ncbi:family 20 glycosylhydrolase [Actinomadura sp. ATCC 31491]|uniref:beta-N-acetylhexosaminidase n=1 Tax=Actinomadura luzonensis TaxID=2805427 RepID=A0ABT0FUP0_9ACTN|nr:family 20 glycosylhydrolase [Actinomadura luzonensis]MCK2216037.1 family 20 glycosylhydrolase [Actinomadura luzonensis]
MTADAPGRAGAGVAPGRAGAGVALVPWPHVVSLDPAATTALDPGRVVIRADPPLAAARAWLAAELTRLTGAPRLDGDRPDGDRADDGRADDGPVLWVTLRCGEAPREVPPAAGVAPEPVAPDERHTVTITPGEVTIAGPSVQAVLRGAATLVQLAECGAGRLPLGRVADGPALAWRGLMLDVVRHPFRVAEIRRVIGLLARYKLNVLHLHLTDSEGWRLRSTARPGLDATSPGELITGPELAALTAYAAARGVTIVPEIDLPGHSRAAVRAYPGLAGSRAAARLGYLDPAAPETPAFVEETVAEFAAASRGRFVHVGGDEPFGMPDEAYGEAVAMAVRAAHAAGRRVVAWQETVRTGALGEGDLVQLWIGAETHIDADAKKAGLPEAAHPLVDAMVELFARAPADGPAAAAAGLPVLLSSSDVLYLDRPYGQPAADAEGEARRARLGFREYPPKTLREMFDWTPESLVRGLDVRIAGVEAAVWAETITGFDDLAFLLLPRLPGVAERAWTRERTSWEDHRARLRPHEAVWRATGWGAAFRPA